MRGLANSFRGSGKHHPGRDTEDANRRCWKRQMGSFVGQGSKEQACLKNLPEHHSHEITNPLLPLYEQFPNSPGGQIWGYHLKETKNEDSKGAAN